jgi:hypothetical protein
MAVPILPILGTLSGLASTAWDTYTKIKRAKEVALARPGQGALLERVEKLEDVCLEQAQMLSELSKDLDQFAQAMQAEMEDVQRRCKRLARLLTLSVVIACAGVGLAAYAFWR